MGRLCRCRVSLKPCSCAVSQLIQSHIVPSIAREAGCKVWGKDGKVLDAEGLSARHYHVMRKLADTLDLPRFKAHSQIDQVPSEKDLKARRVKPPKITSLGLCRTPLALGRRRAQRCVQVRKDNQRNSPLQLASSLNVCFVLQTCVFSRSPYTIS